MRYEILTAGVRVKLPEALAAVRTVVAEITKQGAFSDTDRPIGDLGLKSIDGIQVAVCLETRLGITLDDAKNPLVDDLNRRGRTVLEAAQWLVKQTSSTSGG